MTQRTAVTPGLNKGPFCVVLNIVYRIFAWSPIKRFKLTCWMFFFCSFRFLTELEHKIEKSAVAVLWHSKLSPTACTYPVYADSSKVFTILSEPFMVLICVCMKTCTWQLVFVCKQIPWLRSPSLSTRAIRCDDCHIHIILIGFFFSSLFLSAFSNSIPFFCGQNLGPAHLRHQGAEVNHLESVWTTLGLQ